MLPHVEDWYDRRTYRAGDFSYRTLLEVKGETAVTVVIPARDEAPTVGAIVTEVRKLAAGLDGMGLVDEVIVVDSHSRDRTAAVAREAGARVVRQDLPSLGLPPLAGKAGAMRTGAAASTGDLIVFIDADLQTFSTSWLIGLLGPLLTDPSIGCVKAFYERPLQSGAGEQAGEGGRVTMLTFQPLIAQLVPELALVRQPLGGEQAFRRGLLLGLDWYSGYGIETGLLLQLHAAEGLDAIAQVDLGVRVHTNQPLAKLSVMAGQIVNTIVQVLGEQGVAVPPLAATELPVFRPGGYELHDVRVDRHPPLSLR